MDEPISIDLPENEVYSLITQRARVAECNDVFARLYRYTNAEELKGKRLAETIAATSSSDMEVIIQSIRSGVRLIDFESSEILADGNSYYFLSSLVGIVESGFLVGTWGNVRNITDRKRAEVEREKLAVELENRNAELERFNYTLSHELKTPLITLGFYSGALEDNIKTGDLERVNSDLKRIIKASGKMHKITDELLELSSLDRRTFDFEDTSFEMIVHDGLKQAANLIKEGNVQIQYSSNLPTVKADRKRMIEVIQNLADNAIKYMGDQTEPLINIGVGIENDAEVFFVKDNGIGIDPAYHERVFGLFDKLDPQSEGTGIGLALVKRIIETHGGRIWVESEGLGKGSTFCFTVPDGRK